MYSLMAYSEQPNVHFDTCAVRDENAESKADSSELDTIGYGFALFALLVPMVFVAALMMAEQAARTAGADATPVSVEQVVNDQASQSLL